MDENLKELLREWDKKHVWHPFTQMKEYVESDPLIIERGDGFYLIDVDGKRYIDGTSSIWVNVFGYTREELIKAIVEQAYKLPHSTLLGLANIPSILLAKRLTELLPEGLNKVFYSDNGSTAVEVALKMAFHFWQHKGEKKRRSFVCFRNGYHGDTLGAVSVGGIDLFHKIYRPLLFKSYKAPSPYCYRCPLKLDRSKCAMECASIFEHIVMEHKDELCGVIIEPYVQGAGGIIVQPEGFLSRVWKVTKENDLLFIADEVATGFGRTGTLFACEREGVRPDIICLAKGITGGYLPLAATVTTDEIYEAFLGSYEEFKTFFHGHTYTGNPIACNLGLANLELFEKENLLEKIRAKIEFARGELGRFNELAHVGDVRQGGMMIGIELVQTKKDKKSYPPERKMGQKVILKAREMGLIIRPLGDVVVIMPPLAIDEETLKKIFDIVFESIYEVTEKEG
ncbi:MAG: adenosylmethionine--8-amino-7-oxononanoate transaminase [Desulfobacterota bacterium]|nr:adenosylmethionine--8-amino-7-oxononanoate transaminase [Thermodesulfobacteriota bacterium]MDW8002632.1 adenosylmethionine--8-amino-7-oxononanoate transaminase [Deltaproteobacteria bacterium]